MKIDVFYIDAAPEYDLYGKLAKQFQSSFIRHDPGGDYDSNLTFLPTGPTDGKDIGAYIQAANTCDADIMVCLGSHVRINQDGWLKRIADVWAFDGPGLYGPFGTNEPVSHLRTTAFWCSPNLLKSYPWEVISDQDRYDFELGQKRITNYAKSIGINAVQVTKTCCYDLFEFEPAVLPEEALMIDRFTDMQEASK